MLAAAALIPLTPPQFAEHRLASAAVDAQHAVVAKPVAAAVHAGAFDYQDTVDNHPATATKPLHRAQSFRLLAAMLPAPFHIRVASSRHWLPVLHAVFGLALALGLVAVPQLVVALVAVRAAVTADAMLAVHAQYELYRYPSDSIAVALHLTSAWFR